MLIGIGYKKFSGKDTAADYLVKEHGFVKDSFANDLKEEVCRIWKKTILTWADNCGSVLLDSQRQLGDDRVIRWLVYEYKPRFIVSLLQNHGTELRRAEDPAYWTKKVINRYILSGRPNTVISDVRYPNEADAIRGQGGILIRLNRIVDRTAFGTHDSETSMNNYTWDCLVDNNGSKEVLFKNLDSILVSYFTIR